MPCTCAHVYADQHPGKNRFVGLQSIDDLDIGVVLGLLEIGIHIAGDRHDESLMQTAYNRRIAFFKQPVCIASSFARLQLGPVIQENLDLPFIDLRHAERTPDFEKIILYSLRHPCTPTCTWSGPKDAKLLRLALGRHGLSERLSLRSRHSRGNTDSAG